jgi:hypothetical protein
MINKNKEFDRQTIIDNIIKYIKSNNPSSDAPYHNNEHDNGFTTSKGYI